MFNPSATKGIVDLWLGLDRDGKVKPGTIGLTSAPIVVRDVIVVGMASGVGVSLPTLDNTPGYIRGYDIHTGKLVWTFHTVPKRGEPGAETWAKTAEASGPTNSPATPEPGDRLPPTTNSASSTCPPKRPPAI